MLNKPLVSVIIPHYNNSFWLTKCLESCFFQKGNFELEVIVVDDHSEEEVFRVLDHFKELYPSNFFYYSNPTKGGNAARNYGFLKSNGDFIQWLDSDDFILPNKLETQLHFFQANPLVDVVYSDWQMDFYKNEILSQSQIINGSSSNDFLAVLLENKKWNAMHSYLCKRSVCEQVNRDGVWSEITKVGQDREYFTQLAINGAKFAYCEGVFAIYNRWSAETVSNKYTSTEVANESLRLNHLFYKGIKAKNLSVKYLKILNAELISIFYYKKELILPRFFYPWEINLKSIHWKMRLITPVLYLKLFFKYFFNRIPK